MTQRNKRAGCELQLAAFTFLATDNMHHHMSLAAGVAVALVAARKKSSRRIFDLQVTATVAHQCVQVLYNSNVGARKHLVTFDTTRLQFIRAIEAISAPTYAASLNRCAEISIAPNQRAHHLRPDIAFNIDKTRIAGTACKSKVLSQLPRRIGPVGHAAQGQTQRHARGSRYNKKSERFELAISKAAGSLMIATLGCVASSPALADDRFTDPDTIQPSISVTSVYDDNIFRLPVGQQAGSPTGPSSRSDFDVTTGLGLRVDKSYSLQRFVIDAGLVNYDHTDHKFLDFTAKNLDATWFWAFTPDITGHLIYTRVQQLNSFADFTGLFQRNVNTNTIKRVDADWRVRGEIHLGLALDEFVQRNDQPTYALEDVRIDSVEPTISYQSEAGNSLSLYGRSADGTYLNQILSPAEQIDTNFTEHEEGLRASYQIDGKSGIYAQVGELTRTHEHFASRNFSGPVAQIKYHLQLTGKTALTATASRTLGSYQSDTSSYLATNLFSAGPTWSMTGKTTLGARLQDMQYHFGGALIPTPLRSDNITAETVFADWNARYDVDFILTYTHSNRSSNYPGLEFADNTMSLYARLKF